VEQLGLIFNKDIFFPQNYSTSNGFPVSLLNQIYNTFDVYMTTHLGEGWGLSITEAMTCGIPVIAPNNTTTPEILGSDGDRGYIYPCKEVVYADNTGYRPIGQMDDIVGKMLEAYRDWQDHREGRVAKRNNIISRAREFVQIHSWENVCKQWVNLFAELRTQKLPWQHLDGTLHSEVI
jgi:glycosyltransferase involved in cell wall biosynthesis